jgi:hypothetical protein
MGVAVSIGEVDHNSERRAGLVAAAASSRPAADTIRPRSTRW